MEFSMRRVNGLLKKELKDMLKNINVLFVCIVPIGLCFLLNKVSVNPNQGLSKIEVLKVCLSANLTMVSSFIIALTLAEEKEKNTMRTLMLSAVSPAEFLIGKAMISMFFSLIINITMFFILGIESQYLIKYIVISTLTVVSMVELGAVVGLIAKDQMTAGTLATPLLMLFTLVPMIARGNDTARKISDMLPTYNLNVLLDKIFKGEVMSGASIYNIAVILAWILISAVIFVYTYNRKGLDY